MCDLASLKLLTIRVPADISSPVTFGNSRGEDSITSMVFEIYTSNTKYKITKTEMIRNTPSKDPE